MRVIELRFINPASSNPPTDLRGYVTFIRQQVLTPYIERTWRRLGGPGRPENLNRGNKKGDAAATAKAREVLAEDRVREEQLAALASTDAEAALEALFADLTVGLQRVFKKWLRSGTKEPPRALIDGSREFRQLADRILELRKARGATTQAEEFFAGLSSRLSSPDLAEEPRPVVSLSGS